MGQTPGQVRMLVVGVVLAGTAATPFGGKQPVHAALPMTVGAHDPCGARLPLWDTASGLQFGTLRVGPYALTLGQYGRAGTRQLLQGLHATSTPGELVEQFEFTLPGRPHLYSGLVHAFAHGATQHVCANQTLYVDHSNSAYDLAHPRTTPVRVDGIVTGTAPNADGFVTMGRARFIIQVGAARYSLRGTFKDPQQRAPGALTAISFATPARGWIGGAHVILATADGGRTWQRQYAGPATITSFAVVTPRAGWALGTGTLLRTTDGGQTWTPVGEPRTPLRQIDFISATQGWGVAGATLYHTRDGGQTWRLQPVPRPLGQACFVSAVQGWALTAGRGPLTPLVTSDGGQTWRPVTSPPGTTGLTGYARGMGPAQVLRCAPLRTLWDLVIFGGYAGGEGYTLFRSADGGRDWQAVAQNASVVAETAPGGPAPVPGDLVAVSSNTAYLAGACGPCGVDGATAVGGTTAGSPWHNARVDDLPFAATALAFPTPRQGWLLAHWQLAGGAPRSALFATRDGGVTWTARQLPVSSR